MFFIPSFSLSFNLHICVVLCAINFMHFLALCRHHNSIFLIRCLVDGIVYVKSIVSMLYRYVDIHIE